MTSEDFLEKVASYLKVNSKKYSKGFNFSACELWLCNEICSFFNFEINNTNELYLYNEDDKRDLSLYSYNKENKKSTLISHIEVKLLYPNKSSKTEILNIIEKTKKNTNKKNETIGVFFLVWTSDQKYIKKFKDPNTFYEQKIKEIENIIKIGDEKLLLSDLSDIFQENIMWKNEKKTISLGMIFLKK